MDRGRRRGQDLEELKAVYYILKANDALKKAEKGLME